MKLILIIPFILFALKINAQDKVLILPYKPADLLFYQGDSLLFSSKDLINTAKVIYKKFPTGLYKIFVTGEGQSPKYLDTFAVTDSSFHIEIKSYGRCLYDYPPDKIPVCPKNHKDSIIKIAYGLIPNLDETKYYRGGCVTFGCDPKYYCKKHSIKF